MNVEYGFNMCNSVKQKVTIIIPVLNEERYIGSCLESIVSNDYPKNLMEVLVIDGISSDKTRDIVKDYQSNYPFIKLVGNPKKIVPVAMNIGISLATGNYIIRADAHSIYPMNYICKLIEWSEKLGADNVGAILETEINYRSKKSNSIKEVLSDEYGVGNSFYRVGANEVREVDTVPFGCYRKEIFGKYGLYDERLDRNQDIELNKRIKNKGGKIYLIPDVKCTYYARDNFKDLSKNNFLNGMWNILTIYYTKSFNVLSIRHFVPLFFVLSILIPFLLSILKLKIIYFSIVVLIIYFSVIIGRSIKLKERNSSIFYLTMSFVVLHFSYGFGSLVGILKVVKFCAKTLCSSIRKN